MKRNLFAFFKYLRPSNFIGKICSKNLKKVSPKNVVLITGCDSGLGFNIALLCHSLNMTVISGCLNINSDGAKILQNVEDKSRMITIELNLLKMDTIRDAGDLVRKMLSNESEYIFTALINNAAVMCFGEFEWQTNNFFENQIEVNLIGPMRITKEILPVLRSYKGRIINVTSHCGLQSLPGLAPYAASKAGLRFWNDALRMELRKYDVQVINFIPGSFVMSSNISAKQQEFAKEMRKSFDQEQMQFYGEYFDEYNNYLNVISGYKQPAVMDDKKLLEKFKHALLEEPPKAVYKHEPFRYAIYHTLFRICPTFITDWLVGKFVCMPKFKLN